jgi:polar amino acid transport system permease protein
VASPQVTEPGSATEPIQAVPARHPWRWVATVIVLIVVAALLKGILTSPRFQWDVVRQYFTSSSILRGLIVTILLTIGAMVLGVILGIVLALMRLSPAPIVSAAAWVYIWLFRGTPLLVQILFWYYIAALTGPTPAISIPFTNIVLFHLHMNSLVAPWSAGLLALGLNEGAYMSEIVRAGILSVDEGQFEAAASVGMTRLKTMRLVVLPQAMRVIIPPTGNETISMLKTTSLVSVIAVNELLHSAQNIYSATYQTIPLLIVAMVWYLILTSILTVPQYYLERRYARGASRTLPPTPLQKFRALFTRDTTTFHPGTKMVGEDPPGTGVPDVDQPDPFGEDHR